MPQFECESSATPLSPNIGEPHRDGFFLRSSRSMSRCLCRHLAEYDRVAMRAKFDNARPLLAEFAVIFWRSPHGLSLSSGPYQLPDSTDQMYLAAALAGAAEIIVTMDTRHFPWPSYGPVRILTPRAFLDLVL